MDELISRRTVLGGIAAAGSLGLLAGCGRIDDYGMNGKQLPVGYGAPLRLRVETQIGYKNAKYVDRIELVDRLDRIGKGHGGWWEDFDNAVWYAGQ